MQKPQGRPEPRCTVVQFHRNAMAPVPMMQWRWPIQKVRNTSLGLDKPCPQLSRGCVFPESFYIASHLLLAVKVSIDRLATGLLECRRGQFKGLGYSSLRYHGIEDLYQTIGFTGRVDTSRTMVAGRSEVEKQEVLSKSPGGYNWYVSTPHSRRPRPPEHGIHSRNSPVNNNQLPGNSYCR